ncbi:hypothetical protein CLOM_g13979 [Closterium sp. NIES-68]|nr:hypothetical protein CLOM_g13979 [Closterium sp. NIES-68]
MAGSEGGEWRRAAVALLARFPELQSVDAIRHAAARTHLRWDEVENTIAPLLLNPRYAAATAVTFRGRGRGERELEEYESVCEALSVVLAIAPHSINHLRAFFAAHPPPFLRLMLRGYSEGRVAEDPSSLLPPLRTSLRLLLSSLPTFSSLWDWSPVFPLLLPLAGQRGDDSNEEQQGKEGGREQQREQWQEVQWVALEIVCLALSFDEATRTLVGSSLCSLNATHRARLQFRWRQMATDLEAERAPMFLLSPLRAASLQDTGGNTPGSAASDASSSDLLLQDPLLTPTDSGSGAGGASAAGSSLDGGGARGGEGGVSGGEGAGVLTPSSTSRFNTVAVLGVDLPQRPVGRTASSSPLASPRLVATATARSNLHALVLSLCQHQPLLLEGPVGSGKTALVDFLAHCTRNYDMVRVHMDDQMDGKTLLGSYVCTDVPGEFEWRPGVLTLAAARGLWVLLENISGAPFDLLSSLLPLLQDRCLHLPGHSQPLQAADGFQIFATKAVAASSSSFRSSAASGVDSLLASHFHTVHVHPPHASELPTILTSSFPALSALVPTLLDLVQAVGRVASGQPLSSSLLQHQQQQLATAVSEAAVSGGLSIRYSRHVSLRDTMKIALRLHSLPLPASLPSHPAPTMTLPHAVRERIFFEVVDCLVACVPSPEHRVALMAHLALLCGLPSDYALQLHSLYQPPVHVTSLELRVGRAVIPLRLQQSHESREGGGMAFAATGAVLRLMERVAVCVGQREPVLLVGETGTGKTTTVQHLARMAGRGITVINMSQHSDSADFLGGFKPVEQRVVCLALYHSFTSLFSNTFPSQRNAEFLLRLSRLAAKSKWPLLLSAFRSTALKVAHLLALPPSPAAATDAHASAQTAGAAGATGSAGSAGAGGGTAAGTAGAADSADGGTAGAGSSLESAKPERSAKRTKRLDSELARAWAHFSTDLARAERQVAAAEASFAFMFVEGALVKALREGQWLLMDEINLAPPETLERLSGVLEGDAGSLAITERGDIEAVPRHADFRLFAAMNPATDVGKRDLPPAIRSRFTELFVDEITSRQELGSIVFKYLEGLLPSPPVDDIVDFYLAARQEAEVSLFDGANQRPQYTLRTLARALEYVRVALPLYGFHRSLYDGTAMCFLTLLDRSCAPTMETLIQRHLLKSAPPVKVLLRAPPRPGGKYELFEQFWVERGPEKRGEEDEEGGESEGRASGSGGKKGRVRAEEFVSTPSVRGHLKNLARAVLVRKYPILLQGPTSSGKTSLVEYLAKRTGHRFVRISNHEHTDLQEYLGTYITDKSGRLKFQEGPLVQAVRRGHWIVLDELNLAPSDVLEALNRLLDDNRQLFVPELQETVSPHPHFMLFATQNPPGLYGGRKVLSRAFRNRFLELHVDDIPHTELALIVERRCLIPASYAAKMVEVMKDLQRHRQSSAVFAGKHGFITPRDLFRWANRHAHGYEELARDGFYLLGERLREEPEKELVMQTLRKRLKAHIDSSTLHQVDPSLQQQLARMLSDAHRGYAVDSSSSPPTHTPLDPHIEALASLGGSVVWTRAMTRLFNLVLRCLRHGEPVLLVGETGGGKTTVGQLAAAACGQTLRIINCHQHSDASDFIGGYRPTRDREPLQQQYAAAIGKIQNLLSALSAGEADPVEPKEGEAGATETAAVEVEAVETAGAAEATDKAVHGESGSERLERAKTGLLDGLEEVSEEIEQEPKTAASIRTVVSRLKAKKQAATEAGAAAAEKATEEATAAAAAALAAEAEAGGRVSAKKQRKKAVKKAAEAEAAAIAKAAAAAGAEATVAAGWGEEMQQRLEELEALLSEVEEVGGHWRALFEWVDGPLVRAMRCGDAVMLDEISLADDSVLERLNSVLETKRTLVLAEKGGPEAEHIVAHPDFRLIATMNPGGDYGKKELSPALRNRFTEVWVPANKDIDDLTAIVADRFASPYLADLAAPMLKFWQWFEAEGDAGTVLSVRDLLSWAAFVNATAHLAPQQQQQPEEPQVQSEQGEQTQQKQDELDEGKPAAGSENKVAAGDGVRIDKWTSFLHGAFLVFLDGVGIGQGLPEDVAQAVRARSFNLLLQLLPPEAKAAGMQVGVQSKLIPEPTTSDPSAPSSRPPPKLHASDMQRVFGFHPFYIPRGPRATDTSVPFELTAPTTNANVVRLLRAMQIRKPVLLEGSPGVGKTSLVAALAAAAGHRLVRINLSEQTDMMDLLGSDLPVEGGKGGEFRWADGVFLQALKAGDWVLLDELNLASQSILEGLNSCLDHRADVFLPDLNRTFHCPPSFRIFAAQNPLQQGGGRKGLPKSFLNRFSKVYVQALESDDFIFISSALHPSVPLPLLHKMVDFNTQLRTHALSRTSSFSMAASGAGGPLWEFNLRDVLRWCELICAQQQHQQLQHPGRFVNLLYVQRLRSSNERRFVANLFLSVFGHALPFDPHPSVSLTPNLLRVGNASLPRASLSAALSSSSSQPAPTPSSSSSTLLSSSLHLLPASASALESAVAAVAHNWMVILVGPAASGKTSLIRQLAQMAGRRLREMPLTSATDTTDLLGCFEQRDGRRQLGEVERRVEGLVREVAAAVLASGADSGASTSDSGVGGGMEEGREGGEEGGERMGMGEMVSAVGGLTGEWWKYWQQAKERDGLNLGKTEKAEEGEERGSESGGGRGEGSADGAVYGASGMALQAKDTLAAQLAQFDWLLRIVGHARSMLVALDGAVDGDGRRGGDERGEEESRKDGGQAVEEGEEMAEGEETATVAAAVDGGSESTNSPVSVLVVAADSLAQAVAEARSVCEEEGMARAAGHFEWVEGPLVEAVVQGDWAVLDNANFCNPSVLDRLNPLVEPNGHLLVNERGLVDGKPVLLRPHPDFRLFLCLDPHYGEVSRAMRNRGVEIFLMPPDWPSPALPPLLPASATRAGAASAGSDTALGAASAAAGPGGSGGLLERVVVDSGFGDGSAGGGEGESGGQAGLANQGTRHVGEGDGEERDPAVVILSLLDPSTWIVGRHQRLPEKLISTVHLIIRSGIAGPRLVACILLALLRIQSLAATWKLPGGGFVGKRALETGAGAMAAEEAMSPAAVAAAVEASQNYGACPTLRDVTHLLRLLMELLSRGKPVAVALVTAWDQTFVRRLQDEGRREQAASVIREALRWACEAQVPMPTPHAAASAAAAAAGQEALTAAATSLSPVTVPPFASASLVLPGGWPMAPLPLPLATLHTMPSRLHADISPLITILGQLISSELLGQWESIFSRHDDLPLGTRHVAARDWAVQLPPQLRLWLPESCLAVVSQGKDIEEGARVVATAGVSARERARGVVLLRLLLELFLDRSMSLEDLTLRLSLARSHTTGSTVAAGGDGGRGNPATAAEAELNRLIDSLSPLPLHRCLSDLSSARSALLSALSVPAPIAASLPLDVSVSPEVAALVADASSTALVSVPGRLGSGEDGDEGSEGAMQANDEIGVGGRGGKEDLPVSQLWGNVSAAANRVRALRRCLLQWSQEDETSQRALLAQDAAFQSTAFGCSLLHFSGVPEQQQRANQILAASATAATGTGGGGGGDGRSRGLLLVAPFLSALRQVESTLLDCPAPLAHAMWAAAGAEGKGLREEGSGGIGTTGGAGGKARGVEAEEAFLSAFGVVLEWHESLWECVRVLQAAVPFDRLVFVWHKLCSAALRMVKAAARTAAAAAAAANERSGGVVGAGLRMSAEELAAVQAVEKAWQQLCVTMASINNVFASPIAPQEATLAATAAATTAAPSGSHPPLLAALLALQGPSAAASAAQDRVGKRSLWKEAGHPLLPASLAVLQGDTALASLVDAWVLAPVRTAGTGHGDVESFKADDQWESATWPMAVDPSLRRRAVEALGLLRQITMRQRGMATHADRGTGSSGRTEDAEITAADLMLALQGEAQQARAIASQPLGPCELIPTIPRPTTTAATATAATTTTTATTAAASLSEQSAEDPESFSPPPPACLFSSGLMRWPGVRQLWLAVLPLLSTSSHLLASSLVVHLAPLLLPGTDGKLSLVALSKASSSVSISSLFRRLLLESSRAPSQLLPFQQLLWIQRVPPSSFLPDELALALRCLLHDLHLRQLESQWESATWRLPLLPLGKRSGKGADVSTSTEPLTWTATSGSARFFQSSVSLLSASLIADMGGAAGGPWGGGGATVAESQVQRGQLLLAAAGVGALCCAPAAPRFDQDVTVAVASLAQIIAAHIACFPESLRPSLCHELSSITSQRHKVTAHDIAPLHHLLSATCPHPLSLFASHLLLPALCSLADALRANAKPPGQGLLQPDCSEALAHLGSAWLRVGCLRLHLLLPPGGVDPTSKYRHALSHLEQQHADLTLQLKLHEWLAAVGTDGITHHHRAARAIAVQLEEVSRKLWAARAKSVARPEPSPYPAFFQEVSRFLTWTAGVERVGGIVQQCMAVVAGAAAATDVCGSSPVLGSDLQLANLLSHVSAWKSSVAAFAQRLPRSFPLLRDVTQPCQLAAYEMVHGASLLLWAALSSALRTTDGPLTAVTKSLLAFPRGVSIPAQNQPPAPTSGTKATSITISSGTEEAAEASTGVSASRAALFLHKDVFAALHARASRFSMGGSGSNQEKEVTASVAVVSLLRAALFAVKDDVTPAALYSPATGAEALQVLEQSFAAFVDMWSEMREKEKRQQAEAELVYKQRSTATTSTLELEENDAEAEEEEYRAMFPTLSDHFADLDVKEHVHADEEDAHAARAKKQEEERQKQEEEEEEESRAGKGMAIVWRALKEEGGLTSELVDLHCRLFSPAEELTPHTCATPPALPSSGFMAAYDTATHILRVADGILPCSVDEATSEAHFFRLCSAANELSTASATATSTSASITPAPGAAEQRAIPVDLRKVASPSELALMLPPLQALLQRLQQLLEEWPDNPLLTTLVQIAARLLALPHTTPPLKALVGMELLLTKAQIWQEHAAARVSIAPELGGISRVVKRWRMKELASWPALLDARSRKHTATADKLWFVLYDLLIQPFSQPSTQAASADASTPADTVTSAAASAPTDTVTPTDLAKGNGMGDSDPNREQKGGQKLDRVGEVASSLEDFIRSSPIGEFPRRLQMLRAFRSHLLATLSASSPSSSHSPADVAASAAAPSPSVAAASVAADGAGSTGGGKGGGEGSTVPAAALGEEERVKEKQQLIAVLYNLHNYFAQYLAPVTAAMRAARRPLEVELQQLVTLTRWDDRSYHALSMASEKAHRKLVKLSRKWDHFLKRPVVHTLAAASARIGLPELTAVHTGQADDAAAAGAAGTGGGAGGVGGAGAGAGGGALQGAAVMAAASAAKGRAQGVRRRRFQRKKAAEVTRPPTFESISSDLSGFVAAHAPLLALPSVPPHLPSSSEPATAVNTQPASGVLQQLPISALASRAASLLSTALSSPSILHTNDPGASADTAAAPASAAAAGTAGTATAASDVAAAGGSPSPVGTAAADMEAAETVEDLTVTVISRCFELRSLGEKWEREEGKSKAEAGGGGGADGKGGGEKKEGSSHRGLVRQLKKKAVVDLLRTLRGLGVSSRRTAVPEIHRSPHSWFRQQPTDVQQLLQLIVTLQQRQLLQPQGGEKDRKQLATSAAASGASTAATGAANPLNVRQLAEAGVATWQRASGYYYGNMARLQRVWQAGQSFHKDLTLREVTIATRMLEHLLFVQTSQRATAQAAAADITRLASAASTFAALAGPTTTTTTISSGSWSPLPPQSLVAFWLSTQQQLVASLLASLGDLRQLVASAAATWHELPHGAPSAASAATAVTHAMEDLIKAQASLHLLQPPPTTCSTPGLLSSSPSTLLPPMAPHILLSNFAHVNEVFQQLQQSLEWKLPAHASAAGDAAASGEAAAAAADAGGAGAGEDDGASDSDSLMRWVPGWKVLRDAFIKANALSLECQQILGPFSSTKSSGHQSTPENHATSPPTEAAPSQANDNTCSFPQTSNLTPEFTFSLTAFHSAYDAALTQVLLGVQSLSRTAKQSAHAPGGATTEEKGEEKEGGTGEGGTEGEEAGGGTVEEEVEERKGGLGLVEDGGGEMEGVEGSIVGWSKEAERRLLVLRLPQMVAAVDAVVLAARSVADAGNKDSSTSAAAAVTQRLAQLHVMLDLVVTASLHLLGSFLSLHKAVAKLAHVLANLFTALFLEGFCTPKDAQEEEGGGKGAGKFEEEEGTGMGEGQGKTDVSDEIEDENQLIGTQDEKQEEEGEKGKGDKLPKGIEMQQDFDGEMHDISEDEEEEQEKEEEGEEEQQLDEEMGDVGDDADVVDEKIWKGEDEEEKEGKREKEKFEKDSTISGAREEDLEYRGKDEEDEEGGEGGEDDKEGGEKDGAKDKEDEKEEKGKEDPQAKKDEKGKKQGEEEGEGPEEEGGEEEGEVNEWQGEGEEEGEEMEESHGIKPRKEEEVPELDLPDDMEIDEGEEGGKEGGEDEEGETEVEEAKEAMGAHGRPQVEEEEEEEEEGEVKDDEWDEMDGANDGAGGAAADAAAGGEEEGGEEDGEEKGEGEGEGEEEKERDAGVEKEEGEEGEEEGEEGEEGEMKDGDEEGGEEEGDDKEPEQMGTGAEAAVAEEQMEEEKDIKGTKSARDQQQQDGSEQVAGVRAAGTASVDVMGMEEEENETKGQGKEDEEEDEERKESEKSMEGGKEKRKGKEGGKKERKKKEKEEVNPFRSLGSALEAWKKKASIAGDMEEEGEEEEEEEVHGETEKDKDAEGEEYEYVKGEEEGTGQAAGAATEEQMQEMQGKMVDEGEEEEGAEGKAGDEEEEVEEKEEEGEEDGKESEKVTGGGQGGKNKQKMMKDAAEEDDGEEGETGEAKEGEEEEEEGEELEEGEEMEVDGDGSGGMESSFVSMRWKEEAKETAQVREAEGGKEEEVGEAGEEGAGEGGTVGGARDKVWTEIELEQMRAEVEAEMQRMRESEEGRQKLEAARDAWRKYELLCSGAAQELAEQLRLILEPSMATKLQGDYRSGKRINMKKVIPYIASGFKRDKIWLRRTRPDKRKYQVVLAIDDSRSMSEARCGHLALEAMATICRAMATIEVGEIGVVAFGEPGNVRMLHELDRPFSPEAAVQVISQFSFKQDNTIADEPMVELLRFLSGALDSAAMRYSASAGAGGGGHLEQLVLIVADGRFHEKETLRRTVRHAMGKGQLLAFILLDSPADSILDMQSVSFSDGVPSFSSYLDSFPFPYYILLRDIHALPRTLAGLLRQWLEFARSRGQ